MPSAAVLSFGFSHDGAGFAEIAAPCIKNRRISRLTAIRMRSEARSPPSVHKISIYRKKEVSFSWQEKMDPGETAQEIPLNEAGIDALSQLLAGALEQAAVNRKDIIRLRLAAEEILGLWKSEAGADTVCVFRCGSRLGRMYIEIAVPGKRMDPQEAATDAAGEMLCSRPAGTGGPLSDLFLSGRDQPPVPLPTRPQRISPLLQLLLSILGAGAAGMLLLALPAGAAQIAAGWSIRCLTRCWASCRRWPAP